MTVATNSTTSPPLSTKDASAVRKRRRRTPAGGASDDCFTCTKRSVKCDRRRPYCSQCLEVGNECSGYKTQLTWGVGVASRGKLRGLSLPVAKAPPVPAQIKKPTSARSRASSAAASTQWTGEGDESARIQVPSHVGEEAMAQPTTPYGAYDIPLSMSGETTPSMAQGSWPGGIQFPPKLATHLEGLSSSVDSLSDVDYMSPIGHAFSREELPYVHSPGVMYDSYTSHSSPVPQSPVSTSFLDHHPAPTSYPTMAYPTSEPGHNLAPSMESYDTQISQRVVSECDSLGVPDLDAISSSYQSSGAAWTPNYEEDSSHAARSLDTSAAHWPSKNEPQPQHIHINPDLMAKMPFFMDYYRNTMCPTMVLIDGPGNPYRDHILQLAQSSQSLRHAICALSACNLRMKRRLSLNQHRRESSDGKFPKTGSEGSDTPPSDQSVSEEYQHRNLAVHLLNQQLHDQAKSTHDSVLATILLLCHYRMVESGIAKFHTQFAGVKKILGMRRSAHYQLSRDAAWMEAIFTYFDAISASINDREAQLNTAFFGLSPDSHLIMPGAENLVGCDRELVKTIGKLGRLNLLSQHRPVAAPPAAAAVSPSPTIARAAGIPSRSQSQSPLGSTPLGHAYKTSQSSTTITTTSNHLFSVSSAHRFDGNGFASILDDDELLASATCSSPTTYDDARSAFWREWKDARLALQNWEFDPQRLMASLPGTTTTSQIRDLGSLSEAFRYAALLYTERLASPSAPASQPSFQNLVSQVVYYATSLEPGSSAEKFLLWPLFVAGSECVNELQQNIVRGKCREIMARSGYMNNLAALEVLEQIWAEDAQAGGHDSNNTLGGMGRTSHHQTGGPSTRYGPFRWTGCIGGPGVEVEWIMF